MMRTSAVGNTVFPEFYTSPVTQAAMKQEGDSIRRDGLSAWAVAGF